MNPGLVACLVMSILVGAVAAGLILAAGWSWPLALLAYSLIGSMTLVAAALAVRPGEPRPVPVRVLPAPRPAPALAVTARIG